MKQDLKITKIEIHIEDFPFLLSLPNPLREKLFNEVHEYFLKKNIDLTLAEKDEDSFILNIEYDL